MKLRILLVKTKAITNLETPVVGGGEVAIGPNHWGGGRPSPVCPSLLSNEACEATKKCLLLSARLNRMGVYHFLKLSRSPYVC